MKTGVKIGIAVVLVGAIAVGGELYYLHLRNQADNAAPKVAEYKTDPDDLVFIRPEHPMSLKDEKDLKGQTIWVSAGGQMNYYPYTGHKVDFDHSDGVLLGAEKLLVDDAIEEAVPKSVAIRMPQGDKQILLIFSKPDDPASAGKLFAVPVGYVQGGDVNLLSDSIFFYDDPHKLFAYWGPQVWSAIDRHEAIPGMNERQTQMALGQICAPQGDKAGDRDVVFFNQGKSKRITFVNGKSTKIADSAWTPS
jgi:hypothetical protein